MNFQYSEPLFRPPSEAYSLILQITIGCSWNKCAFCEMYTSKKFSVKKETDVFKEIEAFREYSSDIRKVFLADGNAFVLSSTLESAAMRIFPTIIIPMRLELISPSLPFERFTSNIFFSSIISRKLKADFC